MSSSVPRELALHIELKWYQLLQREKDPRAEHAPGKELSLKQDKAVGSLTSDYLARRGTEFLKRKNKIFIRSQSDLIKQIEKVCKSFDRCIVQDQEKYYLSFKKHIEQLQLFEDNANITDDLNFDDAVMYIYNKKSESNNLLLLYRVYKTETFFLSSLPSKGEDIVIDF